MANNVFADDLDALSTRQANKGGPPCSIGELLRHLRDGGRAGDAESLEAVLAGPASASDVARVLSRHFPEKTYSRGMVAHHRRRVDGAGCRCPR